MRVASTLLTLGGSCLLGGGTAWTPCNREVASQSLTEIMVITMLTIPAPTVMYWV